MNCKCCDSDLVSAFTISAGDKPKNSKHQNTQADHRKIVVVRLCSEHLDELPKIIKNERPF